MTDNIELFCGEYTVFYAYHLKNDGNIWKIGKTSLTDNFMRTAVKGTILTIDDVLNVTDNNGFIVGKDIRYKNPINGKIESMPIIKAAVLHRISEYMKTNGDIHNVDDILYGLARRNDKKHSYFKDYDIHARILSRPNVIRRKDIACEKFECLKSDIIHTIQDEINNVSTPSNINNGIIILRPNQKTCVDKAFKSLTSDKSTGKFLINAIPRFGKTLVTMAILHDLNESIPNHNIKVLILTNQPAVVGEWAKAASFDYNDCNDNSRFIEYFHCNPAYFNLSR